MQPTPQGGLRVGAFLTRSGVFEYHGSDGKVIREYRSDAEVFAAESLASLASAPITLRHPPRMIKTTNYQKYTRGNVHGDPRQDGDKVAATLMVQDSSAVSSIQTGRTREISCGYHCDTNEEPGISPEGEHYDRSQINIRYNHVALVSKGRAGRDVRLRLDAEDNQLAEDPASQPEATPMKKVRIDGVEYEIGTDSYTQARAQQLSRHDDLVTKITRERDEQKARADMAEKERDEQKTRADAAEAPERVTKLVNARADLVSRASSVLGEEKLDGMTDREIHIKTLLKLDPEIKLDEESDDYIRAAFTFGTKTTRTDSTDGSDKARRDAAAARSGLGDGAPPKAEEIRTAKQARLDMKERDQEAWKQPLATSTRTSPSA